ncbi:TPA: hypothetical protein MIQ82_19760 [Klebsiella pneumoniae]|nr:hypothetical protein [Klebsiella pneumoniae]
MAWTSCPAALRLPVLGGARRKERRPDKAFIPPSGTTAGMELEVSCPAALRLPGLRGGARRKERRPDKAFMPPSGTIAGMEPDRPAALRLPGLGGVSLCEGS